MLRTGEVFAGYTIERLLGRGGMGSVYLARHPRLPRLTAMKLLNPELFDDTEIRTRFEREADLVARLDHPNIVPVFDRGVEGDRLWISMRYIDGTDAAALDAWTLSPLRAVQIIAETAKALDFAHSRGVLHRDVKPANILLERGEGGEERVFLGDFGIARFRDDTGRLTQTGTFTATLAYAAPEQLSGAPLDHRADQYSLACTLFRLLTGTVPFDATNPVAVIQGHLSAPPPPVSRSRHGLPPALDAVLAKAMAKHAAGRFDSCTEFAVAAWQALTATAAPWPPPPLPNRPPPRTDAEIPQRPARAYLGPARRSRWHASVGGWLGLLFVLGLTVVIVAVVFSSVSSPSSAGPTTTERPQHTAATAPSVTRHPPTTVSATTDRATIGARAAELSAAFPDMLPETSAQRLVHSGTGYHKAGCFAHAPDSPATSDHEDPGFGAWVAMWSCFGGQNKASFDFYLYGSPADAQAVLDALPANDRATATNDSGHSYTNYTLRDSRNLRPRMVTAFSSDPGRAAMLMYSTGFIATHAEFMDWWKSAPLNRVPARRASRRCSRGSPRPRGAVRAEG
ncbi:serine/threonine protein kinase [Streptomyces gardneri]|uniref:serine/threonine-protein kinase n=1 Tax=Nocardia TaxID=1817 RepID=UPI001359A44C|nr:MULTISPECIES: serine/threonine-protein kinase [Nocardia]MBF6163661.1 serine/threonine protein kinase [Streptomyces gardneri]MBF6208356.1 serine/threonine protein kinase [Streptomyces gardneri]